MCSITVVKRMKNKTASRVYVQQTKLERVQIEINIIYKFICVNKLNTNIS